MTAPMPKAVLFDAYGTLFDVHSLIDMAEQLFPGRGHKLVLLWRDKQIEYSRLLTMSCEISAFACGCTLNTCTSMPIWDISLSDDANDVRA